MQQPGRGSFPPAFSQACPHQGCPPSQEVCQWQAGRSGKTAYVTFAPAPQYCLGCATFAFAHDQLDFQRVLVSVCDTEDKACRIQSQPLACPTEQLQHISQQRSRVCSIIASAANAWLVAVSQEYHHSVVFFLHVLGSTHFVCAIVDLTQIPMSNGFLSYGSGPFPICRDGLHCLSGLCLS